jgi:hypothetical protein
VVKQEREAVVHRRRLDQVVVVQDQHGLLVARGQLVDQRGQQRRAGRAAGLRKQGARARPDAGLDPVQGRDHVAPEAHRVVVVGVQGQPRHRPAAAGSPVGQQCGLAEARRRAHQRQVAPHRHSQALDQVGTRQHVWAAARHADLGGQQLIPRGALGDGWQRGGWLGHLVTHVGEAPE